ncbi:hypothetical protein UlMin_018778 [Ulmus minor]
MAEEFQESEVIFAGNYSGNPASDDNCFEFQDAIVSGFRSSNKSSKMMRNKKNTKKNFSNSVPVKIPQNVFRFSDKDELDEEWDYDDGELVPPHVIVGRRLAGGKLAYSVCTGNGRTLKGRDLSQVRNSILRMTGFLET